MLSTAQNLSEQYFALNETISSNKSKIDNVIQTYIKKAEAGDSSFNPDNVTSDLIRAFTSELQKHDKVKTEEVDVSLTYGEPITPVKAPQESTEDNNDAQNEELSKMMKKIAVQENEARQVIAQLFDIYEQTVATFHQGLNEKKHQLEVIEANQFLQQSSDDQDFIIKSNGKLLDKGSNFPLSRFSKFDSDLKNWIDKQMSDARKDIDSFDISVDTFLANLQKISQSTVNLIIGQKQPIQIVIEKPIEIVKEKPIKIITRWTGRMFDTGHALDLVFPSMSKLQNIEKLDVKQLSQKSLNKCLNYNNGAYTNTWNFEFNDGTKSSFTTGGSTQSSYPIDMINKQIRSISFWWNAQYNQLSGLSFNDLDGSKIYSAGDCSYIKKTVVLEKDEFIVGVKAHYCKSYPTYGSLGDIQFLVAKAQSE